MRLHAGVLALTPKWWYNSDMIRFTLRLTEELHKAIKELAEKEHRSINGQILYILTAWLEQYKKK